MAAAQDASNGTLKSESQKAGFPRLESPKFHAPKSGFSGYQLRHAAGMYWLLDMEQEGFPYRRPLPMNEAGAHIWKMMEQGLGQDEIAEVLSAEYDVERGTALRDAAEFQAQLLEQLRGQEATKAAQEQG